MKSYNYHFECVNCGKVYKPQRVVYLCNDCDRHNSIDKPPKGVLKVVYNYNELIKSGDSFDELKNSGFIELLPIDNVNSLPKLKIGNTPLYNIDCLDGMKLPYNVCLKDDSQNPTYSFKDRASSVVSAYAKENDIDTIIAASTGNAGSSLAGICASQNQNAIIVVPETAPLAKLTQIMMYGAKIIPVKGTYDDAFDLSVSATQEFGWYNRNTAYNPTTIEGKKTISFELFDQLKHKIPDKVFVPVGDGVIISAVYKGFEELLELNIINSMPVIVCVQSNKSDNIVRNINKDEFDVVQSTTIADSISVDIPRNFFMTEQYIQKYRGETITVSDQEIIKASAILSRNTGLFTEPAAAAAFAGMLSFAQAGKIAANSDNVILLTGSGLKDLSAVSGVASIPRAINPTIKELKKLLF